MNIVLVLGSERLYSEIQKRFSSFKASSGETLTLVKLDKSGGCVDRDEAFMKESREAAIREYFFGDLKRTLSPHPRYVPFDEVVVYKIHEGEFVTLKTETKILLTAFQPNSCTMAMRRRLDRRSSRKSSRR